MLNKANVSWKAVVVTAGEEGQKTAADTSPVDKLKATYKNN